MKIPMGFRGRLIIIFTIAMVPVLGLLVWTNVDQREAAELQEMDAARLTVIRAAGAQRRIIQSTRLLLHALAQTEAVRQMQAAECHSLLASIQGKVGMYTLLAATGEEGRAFCASRDLSRPLDVGDRPYYKKLVDTKQFVVSDYIIGRQTGRPVVALVYPLFSTGGEFTGSVFAGLDLTWLSEVFEQAALPKGATLTAVDRTGTVLARYPEGSPWIGKPYPAYRGLLEIEANGSGMGQVALGENGAPAFLATTSLGEDEGNIRVVVAIPADLVFADADRVFHRNLGFAALVLIFGAAMASFSARLLIVKPLRELVEATQGLADGDLGVRADVTRTTGEVEILARAFNRMAERLEHRKREQEAAVAALAQANKKLARRNQELDEFAYIASHDLQEPLRKLSAFSQILKTDLGAALDEDSSENLGFITDAAKRMQVLIQDLLTLSRTGRALRQEPVSLDTCVDAALANLEGSIQEVNPELRRVPLPVVNGDETLLTQLFQNLLGNALKFVGDSPPSIEVTLETLDGQPVFGVRDNGIGIKPEYAEQIFLPFKRLHGRTDYAGTGIGLAICRKVVDVHGGRLWVESNAGLGAHFRFTLNSNANPVRSDEDG